LRRFNIGSLATQLTERRYGVASDRRAKQVKNDEEMTNNSHSVCHLHGAVRMTKTINFMGGFSAVFFGETFKIEIFSAAHLQHTAFGKMKVTSDFL